MTKSIHTRRRLLVQGLSAALGGTWLLSAGATASVQSLPRMTVYKSPSCGCCGAWVTHVENAGFAVVTHDVDSVQPYKEKAGLPYGLGSCHTAFIEGYAIEGHVPASDIKRLITERPDIAGISVPGMPIGSPGMEVPGRGVDAYQVLSFKAGKPHGVFSEYTKKAP